MFESLKTLPQDPIMAAEFLRLGQSPDLGQPVT